MLDWHAKPSSAVRVGAGATWALAAVCACSGVVAWRWRQYTLFRKGKGEGVCSVSAPQEQRAVRPGMKPGRVPRRGRQ